MSTRLAILAASALALAGCRQDMHDGPKYEPLEQSAFFADGRASRDPVPGTVARGLLREDPLLETGKDAAGEFASALPLPLDARLLARGRERYDIFCSPCHDRVGNGQGMIVRRGFKQPPSLHGDRLREAPVGYLFDVMMSGFGQMPSYRSQIRVEDRWAIAAYVRALQLSQHAPASALTAADLAELARSKAPGTAAGHGDAGHPAGHGGGG